LRQNPCAKKSKKPNYNHIKAMKTNKLLMKC